MTAATNGEPDVTSPIRHRHALPWSRTLSLTIPREAGALLGQQRAAKCQGKKKSAFLARFVRASIRSASNEQILDRR
jgi:hypothetical protein